MTKKKSNPTMTPEWFASLIEDSVIPGGVLQRAEQSTAAAPTDDDWRTDPVLLSLSILMKSMWDGNFEQARQETQTVNRCLAMGQKPDKWLLRKMIFDVWE